MTGYASCFLEEDNYQVNIEAKSVNNRFFSLSYRSVGDLEKYEELVRRTVQQAIARGSVNIFVKLKSLKANDRPRLDKENIKAIVSQIKEITTELEISRILTMDTILKIPGTIFNAETNENGDEDEGLKSFLLKALEKTLNDLVVMRQNEGHRLLKIINDSLKIVASIEADLKKEFKGSQKEIAEDLIKKINNTAQMIKSEATFETKDLIKEVALLTERADIAEEINRINSHLEETIKTIKTEGPIGKKLDFLCQEFSREFNTICSKTRKIEISNLALAGKLEIEKIREQVQNIE